MNLTHALGIIPLAVMLIFPVNSEAEQIIPCAPSGEPTAIQYGNHLSGADCVIPRGNRAWTEFTFSGQANEMICANLSIFRTGRIGCISLTDSKGASVGDAITCDSQRAWHCVTLPIKDEYALWIGDDSKRGFPFDLNLERYAPSASPNAIGIEYRDIVTGSLDGKYSRYSGDVDLFTFQATEGDVVELVLSNNRFSRTSSSGCIGLSDPDGLVIGVSSCTEGDIPAIRQEKISKTGTYVVWVLSNKLQLSYELTIDCTEGNCEKRSCDYCDLNKNGQVDVNDIATFINQCSDGIADDCEYCDRNNDGGFDVYDVGSFVEQCVQ